MVAAVQPLTFELCYRKESYRRVGAKFERDERREETLPDRPPAWSPMRGSHRVIADRADELNGVQERAGFRDYFYFPEVVA